IPRCVGVECARISVGESGFQPAVLMAMASPGRSRRRPRSSRGMTVPSSSTPWTVAVIGPAVMVSLLSPRVTAASTSRPAMRVAVPSGPVSGGSGVVVVGAVGVGVDVVGAAAVGGGPVDVVDVGGTVVGAGTVVVVSAGVVSVRAEVDVAVPRSVVVGLVESGVSV
ncbi:MAG: hypothetical protein RLZZ01_436, partial [Actinomycetota bacterium]